MRDDARVFTIRTSERTAFKRCRRAWGWSSNARAGRAAVEEPIHFWLGTGIHYALEDYHGLNNHGGVVEAWDAYVRATRTTQADRLPLDWKEGSELATGMLTYYIQWLEGRDPLQTYWVDGAPQCEVKFEIELDVKPPEGYDAVRYVGTIDRVVIDEFDQLWLLDYKTAARFQHTHLETDQQITSYMWAASTLYNQPVAGFIYQQHKKVIPKEPRALTTGKISTAKQQVTTWRLYRNALVRLYGDIEKIPRDNARLLNELASQESPDRDAFIRRDRTTRNRHQLEAEGSKMMLELEDMLNPNLPLYPNPTMQCSWCEFQEACVALDDGSDWEKLLYDTTTTRKEDTSWRHQLQ